MATSSLRSERGSLPLTLLAVIVIGGLIVALSGAVRVNQEQSRRDRDFHGAILAADAGLQAAYIELGTNPPPGTENAASGSGTVREADAVATYDWEARRGPDGRWEVRVLGEHSEHQRYVEGRVGDRQLFPVALFGEDGVRVVGGGSADWDVYENSAYVPSMPVTVGTNNGEPDLPGSHTNVNPVCYGPTFCTNRLMTTKMPIEDHAQAAYEEGGACEGVLEPSPILVGEDQSFEFSREEEPYCVSEVTIDRRAVVTVGGEGTNPVRVYIQPGGNLAVDGAGAGSNLTYVNITPDQVNDPVTHGFPDAQQLQFYLSGGTVDFSNNNLRIAASVHAPSSFCDFRASAQMYGAALCGDVQANGNFLFAYDLRLADLTDGTFDILGWREESRDAGGFPWSGEWP